MSREWDKDMDSLTDVLMFCAFRGACKRVASGSLDDETVRGWFREWREEQTPDFKEVVDLSGRASPLSFDVVAKIAAIGMGVDSEGDCLHPERLRKTVDIAGGAEIVQFTCKRCGAKVKEVHK